MDTRLLYVIALAIALISGGFFYYSGKSARLAAVKNQNLSYTASNIHLLKTDDSGQLEATTTAKHLEHWEQDNRTQLDQLQSVWYQQGVPNATFEADQAFAYNGNEKIVLTGHVIAKRLANGKSAPVTFNTTTLTGYPDTNRIETDQPVLIQTSQGQIQSQGLKANLNEDQFNFFRIRGQYAPASGS